MTKTHPVHEGRIVLPWGRVAVSLGKEALDQDVEHAREIPQAGRGHAVRAVFVLLDLLECQSDLESERTMGQTRRSAQVAQPLSCLDIYEVRFLVRRWLGLLGSAHARGRTERKRHREGSLTVRESEQCCESHLMMAGGFKIATRRSRRPLGPKALDMRHHPPAGQSQRGMNDGHADRLWGVFESPRAASF